jgi:hypothetical protein
MDRSLLSQPEVIAASRQFVCARLTTYENEAEAKFMTSLWVGRSGEVENTMFTIFAPDGEECLLRITRSATNTFRSPTQMAAAMEKIAAKYQVKPEAKQTSPLPLVADVRLAVDVAACDNLPLVVLFAPDAEVRRRLDERLRSLAWSPEFIGRFTYTTAAKAPELTAIDGAGNEAGLLVVESDKFGLKGQLLTRAAVDASAEQLASTLKAALAKRQAVAKNGRTHQREGQSKGVFWETVLPVTDPQEHAARERTRAMQKK